MSRMAWLSTQLCPNKLEGEPEHEHVFAMYINEIYMKLSMLLASSKETMRRVDTRRQRPVLKIKIKNPDLYRTFDSSSWIPRVCV